MTGHVTRAYARPRTEPAPTVRPCTCPRGPYATFRDSQLVSVIRRHFCGADDVHLDPTTYGART